MLQVAGSALIITMEIERNGTAVVRRSDRAYRFVDRQGSVDVLTDRSGTVLQRMGFDAFGQRREAGLGNPWVPSQIAGFDSRRTRKGYTGHEMVDHANLIHMGGRVYDPRLGRFLSADPLVQAPMQSQSWNRYTYVLNNPLNYTDPSGYAWIDNKQNQQIFRTVVSIAVVAFAPQMLGVANHAAMTAGQKIFIGAVSGAIQTGTLRGALISAAWQTFCFTREGMVRFAIGHEIRHTLDATLGSSRGPKHWEANRYGLDACKGLGGGCD